jgi:hypothetical protein
MSANNTVTEVVDMENVAPVKEKKPRKPTLSAKNKNMMTYGFVLFGALRDAQLLTDYDAAVNMLKIHDDLDTQTAFYTALGEQVKPAVKSIRDLVKARVKSMMPKKPRAPRKKKTEGETESSGDAKPKTPRSPRAKKTVTVVSDVDGDVVSNLVAAAQGAVAVEVAAIPVPAPAVVIAPEVKEKKPRGPKKKTETTVVADQEPVVPAKKETKPRAPKKKVEVPAPVPAPAPVVESLDNGDDDEEIHTREIVINGVTYLIDDDNTLYTTDEDHDEVGMYDPETKTIKTA